MGRPNGITNNMIGLVKVSNAIRKHMLPKTDPAPADLQALVPVGGVLLERSRLTRPARSLFPAGPEGEALFGAHLDALGERLRAAEPGLQATERERADRGGGSAKGFKWWHGSIAVGGLRVRLDELPVVYCGGCRRHLLGPSREGLRGAVDYRSRRRLPPPVAGHRAGRPYCLACLPGPLGAAAG